MVLALLEFLIQPVYSSGDRSQSISLFNSGHPLSILNICRGSPNLCKLSGNLSPPPRLPSTAGSQPLARVIVSYILTWIWTRISGTKKCNFTIVLYSFDDSFLFIVIVCVFNMIFVLALWFFVFFFETRYYLWQKTLWQSLQQKAKCKWK